MLWTCSYCVAVRATNGAGATAVAETDGVLVDATVPISGSTGILDGSTADVDIDEQRGVSTLSATWDAFTDAESGIVKYVGLGGEGVRCMAAVLLTLAWLQV